MRVILVITLTLWSGAAAALTLDLPAAAEVTERVVETRRIALPAGPWDDGAQPERAAEGRVTRSAWRVPGQTAPQDLVAPLRTQLRKAGFRTVYDCANSECGGYDFRFALDLLPAPAMFVDLGSFRYLLAEGPDDALVSILTSRGQGAGYVHVTEVGAGESEALVTSSMSRATDAIPVWEELRADGRAVLDDLVFAPGAVALDEGQYRSLRALAEGLEADPQARIALVGHTDTEGGLDSNLALSERRAQAVRQRLIETYGVAPARIEARGVAYLAPRAGNDTSEGRAANRRVEAVLTD
ncbi:OmpA family protein [Palleronia sp.]|uniref:OmpA family protein n=1 Tax=Palleronia sp. TaxID=1940284 RepID=UPI0035C863FC